MPRVLLAHHQRRVVPGALLDESERLHGGDAAGVSPELALERRVRETHAAVLRLAWVGHHVPHEHQQRARRGDELAQRPAGRAQGHQGRGDGGLHVERRARKRRRRRRRRVPVDQRGNPRLVRAGELRDAAHAHVEVERGKRAHGGALRERAVLGARRGVHANEQRGDAFPRHPLERGADALARAARGDAPVHDGQGTRGRGLFEHAAELGGAAEHVTHLAVRLRARRHGRRRRRRRRGRRRRGGRRSHRREHRRERRGVRLDGGRRRRGSRVRVRARRFSRRRHSAGGRVRRDGVRAGGRRGGDARCERGFLRLRLFRLPELLGLGGFLGSLRLGGASRVRRRGGDGSFFVSLRLRRFALGLHASSLPLRLPLCRRRRLLRRARLGFQRRLRRRLALGREAFGIRLRPGLRSLRLGGRLFFLLGEGLDALPRVRSLVPRRREFVSERQHLRGHGIVVDALLGVSLRGLQAHLLHLGRRLLQPRERCGRAVPALDRGRRRRRRLGVGRETGAEDE